MRNGIWGFATYIQIEKQLCTFKACGSSKEFMIAVDALIKLMGCQNKINWIFASFFTEADSKPSKTSEIEFLAEILTGLSR